MLRLYIDHRVMEYANNTLRDPCRAEDMVQEWDVPHRKVRLLVEFATGRSAAKQCLSMGCRYHQAGPQSMSWRFTTGPTQTRRAGYSFW